MDGLDGARLELFRLEQKEKGLLGDGNFTIPKDISAPPSLTALDFRCKFFSNATFLQSTTLSQQLTSISLLGSLLSGALGSNTIHFPLLEKLSLRGVGLKQFFRTIIAPKLRHVEYIPGFLEPGHGDIFVDLRSKFSNVQFFAFEYLTLREKDSPNAAKLICLAFPNVLHADLELSAENAFFEFMEGSRAVDYWDHIQTLTIKTAYLPWRVTENFIEWLSARLARGLPKLHVKMIHKRGGGSRRVKPFLSSDNMDNYCIVEMVDAPRHSYYLEKVYVFSSGPALLEIDFVL